jgi:ubiquinone/menaquinone biosynthesis C-methylase UbiE
MDQESGGHYGHALHYSWLTSVYDPVVRFTCRETRFKAELLRQARVSPGDRVLDLACGTATLTMLVKRDCQGCEVIGLDGSEQILELAGKKVAGEGLDVSFVHALSYEIPFEDNSFDRVVSSLFFHHLNSEDKRRTLAEVRRVLKPGGELHVADWGKAPNALFRTAYVIVQLLDGFETTKDNIHGLLPAYMEDAGLTEVSESGRVLTPLGSISLYKASKPAD